jgi:hypothetical protein
MTAVCDQRGRGFDFPNDTIFPPPMKLELEYVTKKNNNGRKKFEKIQIEIKKKNPKNKIFSI